MNNCPSVTSVSSPRSTEKSRESVKLAGAPTSVLKARGRSTLSIGLNSKGVVIKASFSFSLTTAFPTNLISVGKLLRKSSTFVVLMLKEIWQVLFWQSLTLSIENLINCSGCN